MNRHERETYDDMLDGDRPEPCPVCTGDEDAHPCSEECEATMLRATRIQRVRGLYEQAHRCLLLARIYRSEEGPRGERERACLDVVSKCRTLVKVTRAMQRIEDRERGAA